MVSSICAKCGGVMAEGFIVDNAYTETYKQAEWAEGPPRKSFWTGLNLRGAEKHKITTFRCEQCGHLELFARSE